MSNKSVFNKINNIKDKKILIKIAEIIIKDKVNYTSNNSGFYCNFNCFSIDAINKIKIILDNPIIEIKPEKEWYNTLNYIK